MAAARPVPFAAVDPAANAAAASAAGEYQHQLDEIADKVVTAHPAGVAESSAASGGAPPTAGLAALTSDPAFLDRSDVIFGPADIAARRGVDESGGGGLLSSRSAPRTPRASRFPPLTEVPDDGLTITSAGSPTSSLRVDSVTSLGGAAPPALHGSRPPQQQGRDETEAIWTPPDYIMKLPDAPGREPPGNAAGDDSPPPKQSRGGSAWGLLLCQSRTRSSPGLGYDEQSGMRTYGPMTVTILP